MSSNAIECYKASSEGRLITIGMDAFSTRFEG